MCLGLSTAILSWQNFVRRAGEGVTFSFGYSSTRLNGFHELLLEILNSFFNDYLINERVVMNGSHVSSW